MWRVIVGSMILVSLAFGVAARTDAERQYLGENTGTAVEAMPPGPHVVPFESLPASVRAAISQESLKQREGDPKQRLVIQNARDVRFIVTLWEDSPSFGPAVLAIDRVEPAGGLRREGVLEGARMTIVAPSGHDVFADGSAALFVDEGSGGSGYDGYSQHIFRLDQGVEEISLPFRTAWADMVDGRLVAMSSDDRWAGYFFGCGQCGPHIPVVSVWEKDRFVPACRQYSGFIESRLRDFLAEVDRRFREKESGDFIADAILNAALLHLQAGHGSVGRKWLDNLEEAIKRGVGNGVLNESRLQHFREDFRAIGSEAAASREECPLSSSGRPVGRHPGTDDRNDYFRYSDGR